MTTCRAARRPVRARPPIGVGLRPAIVGAVVVDRRRGRPGSSSGVVTATAVSDAAAYGSAGVTEQHALVDRQRLERAEVVRPRPGEVGRLDALGEAAAHVRVAESAQRAGEGALVLRRHEQAVDAVVDLLRERRDVGGEHGQPVRVAEDDVLRRRRRAVGQGEDVVVGEQRGQRVGGHVAVADLDPARERRVGREPADDAAVGAPDLAGDGQRHLGHRAHGAQQHVDALVLADEPEREQPGRAGPRAARDRVTARQVRRQVGDRHAARAEVVGDPGLVGAVHEHGVDAREEQRT